MNFTTLFTREEPIAGLEVQENYLRLALLQVEKRKGKSKTEVASLAEIPLDKGIIENGLLKNQEAFIKALKDLLLKCSEKVRFVIVSLPHDPLYSKIFFFPKSVQGQKLEETMELTIGFQLPVNPEEVYLDWEKVEPSEENQILLATIPKNVVDQYLRALESSGLRTVAIESHPMSFGRVADLPKDETVAVVVKSPSSTSIFLIKDLVTLFSRILPRKNFEEQSLEEELKKIENYYEAERKKRVNVIPYEDLKMRGKLKEDSRVAQDENRWLISTGAALRGLLPRFEDNLVSLMPVGTEEAYEYQKAITFLELVSNALTGIAVVFAGAFLGALLLMLTIQQNFNNQISLLSSLPLPTDAAELEARAATFNNLVHVSNQMLASLPNWSPLVEEIRTKLTPGITINTITFASYQGPFSINGVALNRPMLNAFKKSLDESKYLGDVRLPLTNLEQKENISFSISFGLKDPSIIQK